MRIYFQDVLSLRLKSQMKYWNSNFLFIFLYPDYIILYTRTICTCTYSPHRLELTPESCIMHTLLIKSVSWSCMNLFEMKKMTDRFTWPLDSPLTENYSDLHAVETQMGLDAQKPNLVCEDQLNDLELQVSWKLNNMYMYKAKHLKNCEPQNHKTGLRSKPLYQ